MAEVDPDDDSVERWVVWRYRFDAARGERRNVVLVAYDNAAEFEKRIHSERVILSSLQASGNAEAVENISGVNKPPGYKAYIDEQRRHPPARSARKRKR